jgi:hypothetical protein
MVLIGTILVQCPLRLNSPSRERETQPRGFLDNRATFKVFTTA